MTEEKSAGYHITGKIWPLKAKPEKGSPKGAL